MKTVAEFAEHVVRQGASLLDQISNDWDSRIDLGILRIDSARLCVIAQAFGDGSFFEGEGIVFDLMSDSLIEANIEQLGFLVRHYPVDSAEFPGIPHDRGWVYLDNATLVDAWRTVIAERHASRV